MRKILLAAGLAVAAFPTTSFAAAYEVVPLYVQEVVSTGFQDFEAVFFNNIQGTVYSCSASVLNGSPTPPIKATCTKLAGHASVLPPSSNLQTTYQPGKNLPPPTGLGEAGYWQVDESNGNLQFCMSLVPGTYPLPFNQPDCVKVVLPP